eukprot:g13236.t1
MRGCIDKEMNMERLHRRYPPALNWREAQKVSETLDGFINKALPAFPPVLHLWYQRTSKDPSEWLARRSTFAKTLACWSMLGYVVGLGDRHGDNILLDRITGGIVHVDFDCLFGRGLHLAKPEVVPFRLTSNCVSPLGITGVEGTFRHSCEVFMQVVQENGGTISSILHGWIADPFVDWRNRNPEKTIQELINKINGHVTYDAWTKKQDTAEYKKGIMTKVFPSVARPAGAGEGGSTRNNAGGRGGGGPQAAPKGEAGRDKGVPLEIPRQVDALLHAARDLKNLQAMYAGWAPWL